jgi:hypothetical protein
MAVDFFVKGAGKEKTLVEVLRAYEQLYPAKFAFFGHALKELQKLTVEKSVDAKGREMRCTMRVPSELFLFLQQVIPGFGEDSDDITLLCKVWGDFACATKDRRKRSLMWSNKDFAAWSSTAAPS